MSTSPKPARYSNKRDHILRMPLERTIDECVKNGDDVKLMVEKILLTLGEQNLINYGDLSVTSLLTPAGRVLSLLIQKPFLTIGRSKQAALVSIDFQTKKELKIVLNLHLLY